MKYWRPITIGEYWYIALLPENASINTPITKDTKIKKIGVVGATKVNYYDKAWQEANIRNKKINPDWEER